MCNTTHHCINAPTPSVVVGSTQIIRNPTRIMTDVKNLWKKSTHRVTKAIYLRWVSQLMVSVTVKYSVNCASPALLFVSSTSSPNSPGKGECVWWQLWTVGKSDSQSRIEFWREMQILVRQSCRGYRWKSAKVWCIVYTFLLCVM